MSHAYIILFSQLKGGNDNYRGLIPVLDLDHYCPEFILIQVCLFLIKLDGTDRDPTHFTENHSTLVVDNYVIIFN